MARNYGLSPEDRRKLQLLEEGEKERKRNLGVKTFWIILSQFFIQQEVAQQI